MAEPRRIRTRDTGSERALVTPEGVMLRLQLADGGQRFGAFAIDLVLMIVALAGLTIALIFILGMTRFAGFEFAAVVWLLGFFMLRSLWFILFESGVRAATPGKRLMKIRVAARDGGRLSTDSVIARNMLRELEFFLPLSFLGYETSQGAAGAWTALAGLGWSLVFALFPLFNRDRLRVGDLIAGTWVLRNPRPGLGYDLAASSNPADAFAFTDEQLDAYGEFELQTLEDVLRRGKPDVMRRAADDPVTLVATAIRTKIGWRAGGDDYAFLNAYYNQLRARLERGLLFDRRRRDKTDRR